MEMILKLMGGAIGLFLIYAILFKSGEKVGALAFKNKNSQNQRELGALAIVWIGFVIFSIFMLFFYK